MVALRNLDAFTKTRPDLQQKSAVGGLITVVAATTAGLLFMGQIFLYIGGNPSQSLALSQSTAIPLVPLEPSSSDTTGGKKTNPHRPNSLDEFGRIPLKVHVTFPHVACGNLDVVHDGASLSTGELERFHGKDYSTVTLRRPTNSELALALGGQKREPSTVGCTVVGRLRPKLVAGHLAISLTRQAWTAATTTISLGQFSLDDISSKQRTKDLLKAYNVSHFVHSIEFGVSFPKQKDKPLTNVRHTIENEFFGIGVAQSHVKLIPTVRQGWFFAENTYQTSVVDTIIQPQTLVANQVQQLPGFTMTYDFTPLTVYHREGRDSFLIFLSSLISIVGGVFVTVGLLTGCLVHSAQAVAKKID